MRLLLATSNPHKLDEIRAIFAAQRRPEQAGPEIDLLDLHAFPQAIPEPVEDQPTFEGNALLKARHYAAATGMLCLADDSGLEVDALGGEPGVLSARYSGLAGPRAVIDPANNRLLLQKLAGVPAEDRGAWFVCVMALCGTRQVCELEKLSVASSADPIPALALVRGSVAGRILLPQETADPAHPEAGRGKNGFGYDPLFLIAELGRTTAELEPQHKNTISHRGRAAALMWEQLKRLATAR